MSRDEGCGLELWCPQHHREPSELCQRCFDAARAQGVRFSDYFKLVRLRAFSEPKTPAQQAANAALELINRPALVLVRNIDDPFGVELGASVEPDIAIAMLEMALMKIRVRGPM